MVKNQIRKFSIFAFLAFVFTIVAFIALPMERHVSNLGVFIAKIIPFVFGVIAIALFEPDWFGKRKNELTLFMIILFFLGFFCVFVPKLFFYQSGDSSKNYVWMQLLVAFIIFSLTLTYRMAGGTTSRTLRLAFALLALMLSGIEDLAFFLVNHNMNPSLAKIPDVWTWTSHIKVRIGHFPTKYEAYAFITFHVVLAMCILFVRFPHRKAQQDKNSGKALLNPS